jgi:flagellar protein FliO/FliZ
MDVAQKFSRGSPHSVRACLVSGKTRTECGFHLRGLLLALFIFSAIPLTAQVKQSDPVIYPRGTAPAEAPATAGREGANSSFYLAVALLAGAGGWWLWLKRKGGLRGGLAATTHLTIAETKSLGSRQYLVVADYDGKKYLLGVCPGSIELLTPLEGGKGKES